MVVLPDVFLWSEYGRRPAPASRHCVLPPARTGQSATSSLTCPDVRSQKASSLFPPGRGTTTTLIDRDVRLFRQSPPGRELAGHQCTHLGGCGRAWVAAHALELALDVGNGNSAADLRLELVGHGPWPPRRGPGA